MGTKITPYTESENEAKKQQVERMFDSIAHKYDFLNHLFTLGIDVLWRKRCIRLLRKHNPANILDVATGTGDFAIEAIRMGLDVKVTGLDLSAGMLEKGREKIKERGLFFTGIDVIDGYLTEINVTSPTCIREIDYLNNVNISETYWEEALKLRKHRTYIFSS